MKLLITLRDVYERLIEETTFVQLQQRGSAVTKQAQVERGTVTLAVENDVYRVFVDPPSYLPVQVFTQPGELDLVLAIDPVRVRAMDRPPYGILTNLRLSPDEYQALDALHCAGFLNIVTKAQTTVLTNGRDIWSYVLRVREVRQDRVFTVIEPNLITLLRSAPEFTAVSGALHPTPMGYYPMGSYKTHDAYGNLQVTCFASKTTSEARADIDIDDAAGLGHVFQVVRNTITGRPTHPYDIHQILLQHQRLDTRYRLHVA